MKYTSNLRLTGTLVNGVDGYLGQPDARLAQGWKWLKWLQYYNDSISDNAPWISHLTLGYLYIYDNNANPNDIYFNMYGHGDFYTTKDIYPIMYDFIQSSWLYYDVSNTKTRNFYNFKTKQWQSF